MEQLIAKHREEQAKNAQLESDMNKLRESFKQKIGDGKMATLDGNNCLNDSNNNQQTNNEQIAQIQAETIERLQAIEKQMVGGEKANDPELKEKRIRRKRIAEKRLNAITEALKKVDDDDQLLLKAYGDITEELRARTVLFKKAKHKISSLEREVKDLQSEFETERSDYLATIRRQDQQVKLLSQILDKVQSCIRKDCNYANIDKIKSDSSWDEDLQKWRLPELTIVRTTLPPPSGAFTISSTLGPARKGSTAFRRSYSPPKRFSNNNNNDANGSDNDMSEFKLFRKLEKADQENLAANYFRPKRRDELLNHLRKVTKCEWI